MKNVAVGALSTGARGLFLTSLSALGLLCGACAPLPQKVSVDFAEPKLVAAPAAAAAVPRPHNGSIYQPVSYRPTFEDRRARLLGDTVTIQIVESLAASQVSKSTVNRKIGRAHV